MDQCSALKAFIGVSGLGGFAKAARRQGVATSSVTRQVDNLEAHLGVQLFNRSTRTVTLTPAGETYYEQAGRILDDLEEANRSVSEASGPPRGVLRASLPVAFARLHVAPSLPAFLRGCPDITLDLSLTDGIVNLVEDRLDLAIRVGALESPSLISRKLAPLHRVLCASPDYLGVHGQPQTPEDLAHHACMVFSYGDGDRSWRFVRDGQVISISPSGTLIANNSEVLRAAAIGGAGILMMPSWLVGDDIRAGRLKAILMDWSVGHGRTAAGIHAVYLPNRRGSKKVQVFIDHLAAHFGSPPYWDL